VDGSGLKTIKFQKNHVIINYSGNTEICVILTEILRNVMHSV